MTGASLVARTADKVLIGVHKCNCLTVKCFLRSFLLTFLFVSIRQERPKECQSCVFCSGGEEQCAQAVMQVFPFDICCYIPGKIHSYNRK